MALDLDLSKPKFPFAVVAVTTAAVVTVALPTGDITIRHLGVKDDAGTASSAGDKVIIMRQKDEAGVVVAMAADYAAGIKAAAIPGQAPIEMRGDDVPQGADGAREIQMQAAGSNARVMINFKGLEIPYRG